MNPLYPILSEQTSARTASFTAFVLSRLAHLVSPSSFISFGPLNLSSLAQSHLHQEQWPKHCPNESGRKGHNFHWEPSHCSRIHDLGFLLI